jgi:hypothetical protein
LTHASKVIALGNFVEVDRFADCAGAADAVPSRSWAGSSNSRLPHRIVMRLGRSSWLRASRDTLPAWVAVAFLRLNVPVGSWLCENEI